MQIDRSVINSKYFDDESDRRWNVAGTGSDDCRQTCTRLGELFYDVPCEELAHRLLGQVLVRILDNGKRLSGRIVETESYLGGEDKASHSYNGKRTERNKAMYMRPGTAYVYMTYGIYHCMNISSSGDGAAVLIRALEPIEGLEEMQKHRGIKRKNGGEVAMKDKDLCNGPSKMCISLDIDKKVDQMDLANGTLMWIEQGESVLEENIVRAPRIGIGPSAEEWVSKPLRLYVRDSHCISVRNKIAEHKISS